MRCTQYHLIFDMNLYYLCLQCISELIQCHCISLFSPTQLICYTAVSTNVNSHELVLYQPQWFDACLTEWIEDIGLHQILPSDFIYAIVIPHTDVLLYSIYAILISTNCSIPTLLYVLILCAKLHSNFFIDTMINESSNSIFDMNSPCKLTSSFSTHLLSTQALGMDVFFTCPCSPWH